MQIGKQMWYVSYSAIKKNIIASLAGKHADSDHIKWNKANSEEQIPHLLSFVETHR